MTRRVPNIILVALLFLALLVILIQSSFLDVNWPWENVEVASSKTEFTIEGPAEVYKVEAIALDCHARVYASVPVEGRKEHKVAGQVYRTDTIEIDALGDIDTCVDRDGVEITENADGTFSVSIPAEAIRFERPRVDAHATQNSVRYDKGLLGKLTDAFPWVSDSEGLTPGAYSFAQSAVGGSACMEQAYEVTEELIVDAYRAQLIEQGADPDRVTVDIDGEPNFGQHPLPPMPEDMEFQVDGQGVECTVSPDAFDQAPAPDNGV